MHLNNPSLFAMTCLVVLTKKSTELEKSATLLSADDQRPQASCRDPEGCSCSVHIAHTLCGAFVFRHSFQDRYGARAVN